MAAIIKLSALALSKKTTKVTPKAKAEKVVPSRNIVKNKSSAIVKQEKKSSSIVKVGDNKTEGAKAAKISSKSLSRRNNILYSIRDKVIEIDELLKNNLKERQKESEKTRIKTEQKEFKEREEKLEMPKGIKFPGLPRPGGILGGFIDKIKRWIFFTALGWAFNKFFKHLPKLLGIVKLIGKVVDIGEFLFKRLLEGLVTFTSKGIELYKSTTQWIKDLGGQKFADQFTKFEQTLTKFIDLSIIAALLGVDVGLSAFDEFKKQRRTERKGGKPPTKPGTKPPSGTSKPGTRKKPKVRARPKPKAPWWSGIRSFFQSKASKLVKPFKKFAGAAIPGLGAAIGYADAQARSKSGDKLGAFLAGLSAGLDAFTAAVAVAGIASAATGIGIPAAGVLGAVAAAAGTVSMGIDAVLLVRDILQAFGVPVFKTGGTVVGKKSATKKITTRGGKVVGGRITRTSKKGKLRSKKTQKFITSPGKDTGGDSAVKAVFPDTSLVAKKKAVQKKNIFSWFRLLPSSSNTTTEIEKVKAPNAFKVLLDASKEYKNIGGFVGHLTGIVVDSLLGQKPNKNTFDAIAQGITALITKVATNTYGSGYAGIADTIKSFAKGGIIPQVENQTKEISQSIQQDISKAISNLLDKSINKVIGNIKKESRIAIKEAAPTGGGMADDLFGGGGSEGGIASGLGVNKAVSVAKKLIADLGITPAQAAGIVGNFLYESAGMNPAEREGAPYGIPEAPPAVGTRNTGYGWAQWTNDRLDKFLKSYGGDRGKIATDNDNYRYLLSELRGSEPITGMPANDPQAASDWFRKNWERAGIPADEKRRRETQAVFDRIKGLSREQAKIDVERAGGRFVDGAITGGDGRFIQGNSGRSEGVHFHIGTTKPGDGSGVAAAGFRVIKHFLGKKSVYIGRSGETIPANATDDQIRGYISRGQAAHRRTELDVQVGGAYGQGNKVPFPLQLKPLQYSSTDGYGVSADIVGVNAFVGHGRYKPDGSLAPQQRLQLSSGSPDFYYADGGETPGTPTEVVVGDGKGSKKGKEYVIDADSYRAIEKVAPGLLDILNYKVKDVYSLKKYIPHIIASLSKGLNLELMSKIIDKYIKVTEGKENENDLFSGIKNNLNVSPVKDIGTSKPSQQNQIDPKKYFSGIVDKKTGTTVTGAGQDTQLLPFENGGAAILKRGETVLQSGARERMISSVGVDPLNYNIGANANKPTNIRKDVVGSSYGGIIGLKNGGVTTQGKPKVLNLIKPRAKVIFDRLVAGGLTKNAAAGIVANIGVETGYTYDPNTHQDGGPGRGLVQWEMGGRFDTDNINLVDFAKKRKKKWNDLNVQIDFILYELNNHPEYQIVKKKINSGSAANAMKIFLTDYEKAGEPHFDRRSEVLNQIIAAGYLKPKEKPATTAKTGQSKKSIIDTLGDLARGIFRKPKNIDKKEGGGIIGNLDYNKPSIPDVGSFADYEKPGKEPMMFVQKVYVPVPMMNKSNDKSPSGGSGGVNSSRDYSTLSRH